MRTSNVRLSMPKQEWSKNFQIISKIISDECGDLIKKLSTLVPQQFQI